MASCILPSLNGDNQVIINSSKAPPWRKVYPGLNIQGVCQNAACSAFEKTVWVGKEFGTFLIRKVSVTEAPCPCCKQQISKVNNIGFVKCYFTIEGFALDEKGEQIEIKREKVRAPDSQFLTFQDQGKNVDYISLKVVVDRIEKGFWSWLFGY